MSNAEMPRAKDNKDNQSNESTLIVGFEPREKIGYPHLFDVIEMLSNESNVEYFHFRERGYFITDFFSFSRANIIQLNPLRVILKTIIDFLRLRKKAMQFDQIIAIDNFTYIFACLCHSRVILWSHDFVTHDQPRSNTYIQRCIAFLTNKYMSRYGRLIIQSHERKDLFLQSIGLDKVKDCYILPVSLVVEKKRPENIYRAKKPWLMQIGGINDFRSNSDKLINVYQSQFNAYSLLLHGYFSPNILTLLKNINVVPLCSMVDVKPRAMGQLISMCDVGFISYQCTDSNFYCISHASGQLAEFLRQAKPVIVSGNTNLKEFVEKMGIGLFVEDLQNLPEAIDRILANYESYSERSYELFLSTYCLDLHSNQLSRWIAK